MKIYTIVDNSAKIKCTADPLIMYEELYRLFRKYNDKQAWFDVIETELK